METTEQLEPLRGVISLEELTHQRCFLDLTPRQRLLVEKFILSGGDRTFAIRSAYDIGSEESARVMSYTHFASPNVTEAINTYLGVSIREALRAQVDRALRKKHLSVAEVNALRLKCDLAGIRSEEVSGELRVNGYIPKMKKFAVGDIATRDDGKKFRITAIDEQGRPTEGDPVEDNK